MGDTCVEKNVLLNRKSKVITKAKSVVEFLESENERETDLSHCVQSHSIQSTHNK